MTQYADETIRVFSEARLYSRACSRAKANGVRRDPSLDLLRVHRARLEHVMALGDSDDDAEHRRRHDDDGAADDDVISDSSSSMASDKDVYENNMAISFDRSLNVAQFHSQCEALTRHRDDRLQARDVLSAITSRERGADASSTDQSPVVRDPTTNATVASCRSQKETNNPITVTQHDAAMKEAAAAAAAAASCEQKASIRRGSSSQQQQRRRVKGVDRRQINGDYDTSSNLTQDSSLNEITTAAADSSCMIRCRDTAAVAAAADDADVEIQQRQSRRGGCQLVSSDAERLTKSGDNNRAIRIKAKQTKPAMTSSVYFINSSFDENVALCGDHCDKNSNFTNKHDLGQLGHQGQTLHHDGEYGYDNGYLADCELLPFDQCDVSDDDDAITADTACQRRHDWQQHDVTMAAPSGQRPYYVGLHRARKGRFIKRLLAIGYSCLALLAALVTLELFDVFSSQGVIARQHGVTSPPDAGWLVLKTLIG